MFGLLPGDRWGHAAEARVPGDGWLSALHPTTRPFEARVLMQHALLALLLLAGSFTIKITT